MIGMCVPPLPGFDLERDLVWPPAGGGDVVRWARTYPPHPRVDLVGQPGKADGSGGSDGFLYEAGSWCWKTSLRRRFEDRASAVEALRALADAKTTLGRWVPPSTALALAQDRGGSFWLWTICPWIPTLRSRMARAEARGDQAALGEALELFVEACVSALRDALERRLVLDVHPSNFGVDRGALYYIDDDVGVGDRLPSIGYSILQRIGEYEAFPEALERYLRALESALRSISPSEQEALDLPAAIEQTYLVNSASREARARIVRSLGRRA